MSDDLVKRLRNTGSMSHAEVWETFEEAANRIEELEAERDEALNQLDSARHSVDVLEKRVEFVEGERRKTFQALLRVTKIHDEVEANLAKAVGALEDIKIFSGCGASRRRAIEAIEKLKGEK